MGRSIRRLLMLLLGDPSVDITARLGMGPTASLKPVMRALPLLFALYFVLHISAAAAQSNFPPCAASGLKHNCHGRGQLPEGGSYEGEYRFDVPNGFGEVTFPDGSRYVGQLVNGNFQGFGTFTYPNRDRYIGEWFNDQQNGMGTYHFASGARWVGAFRNGNFNGEGVEYGVGGQVLRSGWWRGRLVFPSRQAMIQSYAECLAATSIAKAQGTMSGLADVTLSMGRILDQLKSGYAAISETQSELDRMNKLAGNEAKRYAHMDLRQGLDFAFRVIEVNRCAGLATIK